MHDVFRGVEQSPRRVELNDETLRALLSRLFDRARNIAGRRRPDRAIDFDDANFLGGPRAGGAQEKPGSQNCSPALHLSSRVSHAATRAKEIGAETPPDRRRCRLRRAPRSANAARWPSSCVRPRCARFAPSFPCTGLWLLSSEL